ncbi:15338_t:CDS:2 [Entrophospora sp. SA101]|nr:15338_t:CDS:2 [Entrophospora sp. SA101]
MVIQHYHPLLKLNYYKKDNWERRYIDSAQKLINSEISNNENDGEDDLTSQIYKCKHIAHNSNELNLYLKDPNAQEKTDVLLWWKIGLLDLHPYSKILKSGTGNGFLTLYLA